MTETAPTQTHPSHQPAPKPAPPASLTTPRVSSSHSRIHVLHLHAVPPARRPRRAHSGTRAARGRKPRTSRQKRRRNRRTRVHFGMRKNHDISRVGRRTRERRRRGDPAPTRAVAEWNRTEDECRTREPRARSPDPGELHQVRAAAITRIPRRRCTRHHHCNEGATVEGAALDLCNHRANRAAPLRRTAKRAACTQQLRRCNSSEPCNRRLHECCSTR